MRPEVLRLMKCPYCDSDLQPEDIYEEKGGMVEGYIACECSKYPLLDGILILTASSLNNHLVRLIKERRTDEAIGLALGKSNEAAYNAINRALSWGTCGQMLGTFSWQLVKLNAKICYMRHLMGMRPPFYDSLGDGNFDNYLKERFSSESLWSFYPFVNLMKENCGRILDLSCGMGHTSFLISANVKPELIPKPSISSMQRLIV